MVPISSSRTVTAQRPGSAAMISEIHRQSTVGMPTTARATMPPSGDEDPLPERWAYALPAGPSSAPAEARADPHTVDRRCREARMSSLKSRSFKNFEGLGVEPLSGDAGIFRPLGHRADVLG